MERIVTEEKTIDDSFEKTSVAYIKFNMSIIFYKHKQFYYPRFLIEILLFRKRDCRAA